MVSYAARQVMDTTEPLAGVGTPGQIPAADALVLFHGAGGLATGQVARPGNTWASRSRSELGGGVVGADVSSIV